MSEKVETVLGSVAPRQLGRALTHEHLHMEFTHFYRQPPPIIADKFTDFSLEKVGYIRQYPYSLKNNLLLNDKSSEVAVMNDVKEYKRCGGGTIVENSTEGLNRNVKFLKQVSKDSNVHIVAGTGYYIGDVQSAKALELSVEELYGHMLRELTKGCAEDESVKAGFVGEVASVWPLTDFERKSIRASAQIQAQTGCGVSFHPHRDPAAPFEIIRLYLEAGGKADKAVMSHLDRTLLDSDKLLAFSNLGTYCQFDLFGIEVSHYQLNMQTDMPSDAQRLDMIKMLVAEGKEDRVLMSHDIHTKHRLLEFGGHGYCHIINNVLPKMAAKGISQQTIDKITIGNPATWLTYS